MTSRAKRSMWVLRANGIFLLLAGGVAYVQEMVAHFLGWGDFAAILRSMPGGTIGFAEAHGLAVIFGVTLWRMSRSEEVRSWHLTGVGIHVLLGGSNLLFWSDVFVRFHKLPLGVITTAFHIGFVIAHLWCIAQWRSIEEKE